MAGFNQFFDDLSGSEAWIYGGAIDQEFGTKVFGGAEYTRRDLTVPLNQLQSETGELVVVERDASEDLVRGYLFATPDDWLALGAQYQYEKFERDPDPSLGIFSEVRTHRVPLSAQLFHPCGLSASLAGTFIDQKGSFLEVQNPGDFIPGEVNFWTFDAALRYRLPGRRGFLVAGVSNFTDNEDTYQPTDLKNPTSQPGRTFYGRVTLALP